MLKRFITGSLVAAIIVVFVQARQAQAPPSVVRVGHTSRVDVIALSPDGKVLASVGQANDVKLWDVATGKPLMNIDSAVDAVARLMTPKGLAFQSLAFSPDGKILALGSDVGITLFDTSTGKEITNLANDKKGPIVSLAFSRDGKLLAAASSSSVESSEASIWDVVKRTKVHTLGGATSPVAFGPTGLLLATSGKDEWVQVWNARTGKKTAAVKTPKEYDFDFVRWLSFNNTGTTIAAFTSHSKGLAEYEVLFLNTVTGKPVKTAAPVNVYHSGSYTADGRLFICDQCSGGSDLALIDPISGKLVRALSSDSGFNDLRSLSYNGRFAAFLESGRPHTAILDLVSKKKTELKIGYSINVISAAFSPDSRKLVVGYDDGRLIWWDTATSKIEKQVRRMVDGKPEDDFLVGGDALSISSDSLKFLDGYHSSTYSTANGERLFHGDTESSIRYLFAANGKKLIGVSDETVTIRDAVTGDLIDRFVQRVSKDKDELSVGSSYDTRIITLANENLISFWDATNGNKIKELPKEETSIKAFGFSPDGRFFAFAGGGITERKVKVIRYISQEEVLALDDTYPYFAFSPDSTSIATINDSDELVITPLSDGEEEPVVSEESVGEIDILSAEGVSGLVFSPDGKKLAVYGSFGITIFDAKTAKLIRRMK